MRSKELETEGIIDTELKLERNIDIEWRGKRLSLPIKLKGYIDRLSRDKEGRLVIEDEKSCYSFSNPDKIDGRKIIQAVTYYLLAYSEFKEEPYKMSFIETKYTKSKDGIQTKTYDIIFNENELFFDFFFRIYGDVVKSLSGESVYLPNLDAMFDNEVGIIAYTHRLDIPEDKAKLQKLHKVDNITDILRKRVASVRNMKSLESAVERSLAKYNKINYSKLKMQEKIQQKLMEFGIVLHYVEKEDGPNYTIYKFEPSIGVKMAKLHSYTADIEQAVGKSGVRIVAPIPDTSFIGIEIEKNDRKIIKLSDDIIGTKNEGIPIGLGRDGDIRIKLDDMPHMLVAGSTGSGKSVFLTSIIKTIMKQMPNTDLYLIDPKMVELTHFADNAKKIGYSEKEAIDILTELYGVMEERFCIMQKEKVKHHSDCGLNKKVCVIDEFGDLLLNAKAKKDIQSLMIAIAQKGRAAGIHLIVATQRPDADVITGLIKANRSEEHTSELQSHSFISYAVFCLKKKNQTKHIPVI